MNNKKSLLEIETLSQKILEEIDNQTWEGSNRPGRFYTDVDIKTAIYMALNGWEPEVSPQIKLMRLYLKSIFPGNPDQKAIDSGEYYLSIDNGEYDLCEEGNHFLNGFDAAMEYTKEYFFNLKDHSRQTREDVLNFVKSIEN